MDKAGKVILGVAAAVGAFFGIKKLVEAKEPVVCTSGTTKCVGFDLYECSLEHTWVLLEANSPDCGWVPGEAEFVVTDLLIEPPVVNVGEPVAISVQVSNVGDKVGTKTVTLEVV